jgi:hypothetical protein
MANDGYNVTMPACFGAQNAKPILSVVLGHPLDEVLDRNMQDLSRAPESRGSLLVVRRV